MTADQLAKPEDPDEVDLLVDLVVQRILVSDEIAAIKFRSGAPVEDLRRERQVLAETGRRAMSLGLDRELAVWFMERQIHASKIVQSGLLARWQAPPASAPESAPGLDSLREELDGLDQHLLEPLLRMGASWADASLRRRLQEACTVAADIHDLDALHRRALAAALTSSTDSRTVEP